MPVTTTSPHRGSADGGIPDAYQRIVDPFVALARASAVTTTIKLGTAICLVPEHNPLMLAKTIATGSWWIPGSYTLCTGVKPLIFSGFFQRCRIGRDPRENLVKTTCYAKLDQLRPWNPI
jgi:hypothetical protein